MKESFEELVFVYGTLQRGQHNHHLMRGARWIGNAVTAQAMVLRSYGPGTVPYLNDDQAIAHVEGELYGVSDPEQWAALDRLEGVNLGGYRRELIWVVTEADGVRKLHRTWTYLHGPLEMPIVPTGRVADFQPDAVDDVWYFAYGSNLWAGQTASRTYFSRRERAVLHDHVREFTKRSDRHGACATVRPLRGSSVPGALYRIPRSGLAALDRCEGAPTHYTRERVVVERADGTQLEAVTYIANPAQVEPGLRPTGDYVARVVCGGTDLWGPGHERVGTRFPDEHRIHRAPRPGAGWSPGHWDAPHDPAQPPMRPLHNDEFHACSDGGCFWGGIPPAWHPGEGMPCAWEGRVDGHPAWILRAGNGSDHLVLIFATPHPLLGMEWDSGYWNIRNSSDWILRFPPIPEGPLWELPGAASLRRMPWPGEVESQIPIHLEVAGPARSIPRRPDSPVNR